MNFSIHRLRLSPHVFVFLSTFLIDVLHTVQNYRSFMFFLKFISMYFMTFVNETISWFPSVQCIVPIFCIFPNFTVLFINSHSFWHSLSCRCVQTFISWYNIVIYKVHNQELNVLARFIILCWPIFLTSLSACRLWAYKLDTLGMVFCIQCHIYHQYRTISHPSFLLVCAVATSFPVSCLAPRSHSLFIK